MLERLDQLSNERVDVFQNRGDPHRFQLLIQLDSCAESA